jgi:predicted dehydrogenase
MTTKLHWGLLSTARINRAILDAMPGSERGQVWAVASRDAAKAEAYAREHHLPRWHGSYEALLADPDVHVIYNPLPNHLHAEWTIKALEAGKHVLCEKPFALTLGEVEAMYAAAQRAGRALAEAFMYRHHPKIVKTKELLESGALGQVRYLRASFSFALTRSVDVRWNPEMGGGSLWDVGCYPVSLARYLFGAPERVLGWQKLSPSGVDETFAGTLFFPGERVAQFDCSFRMPYRTYAEVVGDEGVLTLNRPFQPDAPESTLVVRRGDQEETFDLENPGRYRLEIEDLHDAVLLGRPPRITPAETRGHVETLLALYAAARANSQ